MKPIALVSGANRGIGKEACRQLAVDDRVLIHAVCPGWIAPLIFINQ